MQTKTPLILIADDDSDMRFLLQQIMEQEGYDVIEAEDGEQCIASYQNLRPDIVLLDGLMPVLDGFETCARLKALPGSENIPILIITGLNDNWSVDEAFRVGATDYINKPINRAVLRHRVSRLLRGRQAEEVLRLRERAISAASNGIMITNANQSSNLVTYVNPAFERLTGYSAAELLGQKWDFLQGLDTDQAATDELTQALQEGREGRVILKHYRKNNSFFWNELFISPVHDAIGRLSHFVWVTVDITERVQVEAELRDERDFTSTVLDTAGALMLVLDSQGRIVRFNRACENVTEYSFEEVRGKPFWDIVLLPEDMASVKAVFEELRTGHFPSEYENYWITRTGQLRMIAWYNNAVADKDGAVRYIVSTGIDITDRKQAEHNLQELNQQLVTRVKELNQRTHEISLLSEMGGLFQACRHPEEAYRVVGQLAPHLFPGESGALYTINNSHSLVETVATWGTSPPSLPQSIYKPEECWALRRGRLHLVQNVASGIFCQHFQESSLPAAYLCVPMMAQGEALGVFTLSVPPALRAVQLSQPIQQLAVTVAEQIAMALANLRLQETLHKQSITDPLTGLFNRRYMEVVLERELRRAVRSQRRLGIIMLDIDHFKQFNDTFGHDAGDYVLREVGNLLRAGVRTEDFVCRYGGEEFTLIIPEIGSDELWQRAESLRDVIKRLKLQQRGQLLSSISASLGLAFYPEHGVTAEELLRAADAALYQAKGQGRDQSVIATYANHYLDD